MEKYYLGLDVGIGSIGWSVINREKNRIEDFGVRLFESGEDTRKKERFSQKRRRYRGIRRLYRRRSHRKQRLKNYLGLIGLTSAENIDRYYENCNNNIIELRYNALSEKLSPEEIAACLIHICNNRGYNDFYEVNADDLDDAEEKKKYEEEHVAISNINRIMNRGGYRTPAEMICKCSEFVEPNSVYRKYHNSGSSAQHYLISRPMLEREVSLILKHQSNYYKCLTEEPIDKIKQIIFSQRDFETGPGDENDKYRKFTGYLDTLGKCRFYKEEDRGCRFTVIADIYALVNVLSQYSYTDDNGTPMFSKELANSLIEKALESGSLTKNELKKTAKTYNIMFNDNNADTPLTKCFKYIKTIKPIFEKYGYDWNKLIDNYTDTANNVLNRIGIVLSQSQTPKRRKDKLIKLDLGLESALIDELVKLKLSGTSNVSYKYMKGSIEAFCEGEIYGEYQAKARKDEIIPIDDDFKPTKLPPFKNEDDCEFFNNPVVFRAINETRKLINAIINKYGYPVAVNIETADELNKTFEDRAKDNKRNKDNEKENDRIIKEICDCIHVSENEARKLIEKYKLWEAQEGKCLYSGKPIDKESMLRDRDKLFEVDHIIPYSLILDNTINNKALVYAEENQTKGQRSPLMYMDKAKASDFRARVNSMLKNKKCSKKKYRYLMLSDLDNSELLDEWKSRNLNDTRYICKYLVNYLRNNLRFDRSITSIKEKDRVFAVKSKFTSMFRRMWLNEATWGRYDKGELKKNTFLDHAVDAIVIANCRPEYVILAGEKLKLSRMYHQAGKKITAEYEASKNACIESLFRYYGMDRKTSNYLLSGHTSRLAPVIPNLREEVDKRLWDKNIFTQFWKDDGIKEDECDQKCEEMYRENMDSLYKDDPEFAASLRMPVVSLKPDRKYRGIVTDENAICIREIDGELMQLRRKSIGTITEKDIDNIYTDDRLLIDSLRAVFAEKKYKDIDEYLKETEQPYFVTSAGKRVNKVTVKDKAPFRWLTKTISESNYSFMDDRNYYCIELYKDSKGNNNLQGIAMSDIVHKNGKLWLKPDYRYPDDYCTHVMYIFPGDYLRIKSISKKSGEQLKFEGYYKSVKTINRNQIYLIINNKPDYIVGSITKKDICIKLTVDLIGRINGEKDGKGISCGEPLSLLKEKR